ncbi:MAG: alpha/beta hydrolase [Ferruginibacter sp.]|nr:alpha/beta hydrolase [Ferruginibacter sp.]
MENKSINYENQSIHYTAAGEGKLVVLLHGFGEDRQVWKPQVDFLKDKFRLIVPDIPGSGRSSLLPNANIDTYANVIKEIVQQELTNRDGAEPTFAFIGHSMGGYVAIAFAEKFPELLNSLGMVHSSVFADNQEKKETRAKAIDFIKNNSVEAFLKTSTPALFTKAFAEANPEVVNGLIEEGKKFTPEALIQYYEAMIQRPDRTEVLKTFPKPVLYIIGEHDTAIPLDASLKQCYLASQSHVHILAQSAHMGMWEETSKVNDALLSFLQS